MRPLLGRLQIPVSYTHLDVYKRQVLKPVDDTSIAYTLSAPVTRTSLILTQGFYLIGAMFVLFTSILAVSYTHLSFSEILIFFQ